MIAGIAAFGAWLGASIVVLADGRLGLALGMGISAAALAVTAWQSANIYDAAAIFAGGILAAALRLRSGQPGWNFMPPGSTPRLVLCLAGGLLALWVASTVTQGPGTALRFSVMTAIVLPAARILQTDDVATTTTAAGSLLLAVAVASALGGAPGGIAPGGIAPFVAAALAAAGAAWWPRSPARAG